VTDTKILNQYHPAGKEEAMGWGNVTGIPRRGGGAREKTGKIKNILKTSLGERKGGTVAKNQRFHYRRGQKKGLRLAENAVASQSALKR